MTINLKVPQVHELKPRITVFGVGGAGCNAVNNMIRERLNGCEFVVANTDAQALALSHADRRIQLGTSLTQGLGAGSKPEIGRGAAEEGLDEIAAHLEGSHMVFITAGMGGGTGTGAAPVIARAAKEQGILTVGVVTKPFQFEGAHRMRTAEAGVKELQQWVDTLIVIPNQNLFRVANERTTFAQAFNMADEVLHSGVRGITDLMIQPGLINLDFSDVRTVMNEMGKAMMGTGEATGERRALDAAEAAISNPLLDEVSMKGARGVLIHITGGSDLTLFEVDEAANRIRSEVDPDANIIIGSTFNDQLEGRMRVSIVATGIDAAEMMAQRTASEAAARAVAQPAAAPAVVTQFPRPAGRQPAVTAPVVPVLTAAKATATPSAEPVPAPVVEAAPAAMEPAPALTLSFADPAPSAAPAAPEAPAMEASELARAVKELAEAKQPPRVEAAPAAFRPDPLIEDTRPAAPEPKAQVSLFRRLFGVGAAAAPAEAPMRNAGMDRQPGFGPAFGQGDLDGARATGLRLEPGDRLLPPAEDDQLDIPAFLRRQAN